MGGPLDGLDGRSIRLGEATPHLQEVALTQDDGERRSEIVDDQLSDPSKLRVVHQSRMRNRKKVSPMMTSSPPKSRRSVISSPLTSVPFADLLSSM